MRVQGGVSAGSCSRRGACDEPSAAALFLETRCRAEEAAMRDYYYASRSLPATICWLRACGTHELARSMHSKRCCRRGAGEALLELRVVCVLVWC